MSTGKGNIKLIDSKQNKCVSHIKPSHEKICSLHFSHKNPNLCLAGGSEKIINLIDFVQGKVTIKFAIEHKDTINQTVWHPNNSKIFGSCGSDGYLNLWDITNPKQSISSMKAHDDIIYSCDFNKYTEKIVTASGDKSIKLWDLRNMKVPYQIFAGHRHPVRKVKFSPHEGSILASGGYDMDVHIWDINDEARPLKFVYSNHTEFVHGLDFNLYHKRQIASCGWDGRLLIWNWDQPQPKIS